MIRIGSLFSGYGGLDMAARMLLALLGLDSRVVFHSDVKPAACALLAHHHPGVPNIGDITRVTDVPPADVWTFGWPCQPHSSAGKRLGKEDPRALWPEVQRLVAAHRPAALLGENVDRITANGELRRVVAALAELGYVGAWRVVSAADRGACHLRKRCFLVAVDPAADAFRTLVRDESGRRGGPDRAGAGVAGDDGASRPVGLTLLPTPRKGDGIRLDSGRMRGPGDLDLPGAVADPYRWGRYANAVARHAAELGRPAPEATILGRTGTPVLSPAFVEWMMMVPTGHVTGVPALSRSAMLSLLGDGVVPVQAAHAQAALLRHLAAS